MKSFDKEFTKFVKTNNHNLDIILPVILGSLILFFIIFGFINKKKENYSNNGEEEPENKSNFPWWGYLTVILFSFIIIYLIYVSFKNTTFLSSGKKSNKGRGREQYPGDSVVKGYFEGAEQLLKNDGYKKLKSK